MNLTNLTLGILLGYIGIGVAIREILAIKIRMCIYNNKKYTYNRLDTFLMYSFYPVIIIRDVIEVMIHGR